LQNLVLNITIQLHHKETKATSLPRTLLFSINIDNLTLERFRCLTVVKLKEILKLHDEPITGYKDVLVTKRDYGNKFIVEK